MIINVLTRTSGRPKYLETCMQTVQRAALYARGAGHEIRHYVHIDDTVRLPIRPYQILVSNRADVEGKGSFPWNLYLNKMMNHVEEGWICILDDDDWITQPERFAVLCDFHALNEDTLLLWKVSIGGKVFPRKGWGEPRQRDISNIGMMFHSSHVEDAQYDANKEADFRVIHRLWKKLAPKYMDVILTGAQESWGFGSRQDKIKNV